MYKKNQVQSFTQCYQTFDRSARGELPGQCGPGEDRAQHEDGGVIETRNHHQHSAAQLYQ